MKIEIKCRFTGKILFEHSTDKNTIKLTVEAAVQKKVSLSYADLRYADLSYADLRYAVLRYADLRYAVLRYDDLRYAVLSYADLRYADLRYADLRYAVLSYADLRYADLSYAVLRYAVLSYAVLRYAVLKDGSKVDAGPRPYFCLGPIGADASELIAFSTDKGLRLQRGCFFGTLEEFKSALKNKHGNNDHAQEYTAALDLIKTHFNLWKKGK